MGGNNAKLIIAGGGTGGHIFPAIAIANALKKLKPETEILFVGAVGKMEMEKVPQAGYPIEGLDISGFNRSSLIKNAGLPLKLIKSFFQVRKIFNRFKPDAVVGVGGYSSFPVLRLAQARGIKSFIHESNSFAGKSNILLGKKATEVFVATDGMEKFFPAEAIKITGNPIRPAIVHASTFGRKEAKEFFHLNPDKPTLLVVGGSLGARSINEAIGQGLDQILDSGLQLIWQTGKHDSFKWQELARRKENVWVNEFITEMEKGYAAADVVISRSGAMAVAELCVVQKPVVFVPYPFAAEDHQTANAQNLVQKQAALMVRDSEAADKLVETVLHLVNNKHRQEELRINIAMNGVTNADEKIAQEIFKHL